MNEPAVPIAPMKHCTFCGRDNPSDAAFCMGCGRELLETVESDANHASSQLDEVPVTKFLFEPFSEKDKGKAWVTLVNCATLGEADVVVSHLEAAQIPAFIPDEYGAMNSPFRLMAAGGIRVQVSPKDYEEARAYLASFESGPAAESTGSP